MGRKQAQEYINQYINRLKQDLSSCKVILYGSLLKGNYQPGISDVDLLVISEDFKDMGEDERFDLLYKKTVGLPLDWHIYGLTSEDIKKTYPLTTLSEALRYGKTIS